MSIHEIIVFPKDSSDDPLGREVQEEAQRALGIDTGPVRTAKLYRVEGVTDEEAGSLVSKLLTDPITERGAVRFGRPATLVEVAYRPGVMNPEAASIMKAAGDLGIHPVAVDSSHEFMFGDKVDPEHINTVVGRLLVNKTVQQVITEKPETLTFEGSVGPITIVPIRNLSEAGLMELSRDKLFLDPPTMKVVQGHFQKLDRDPKDGELEAIAARWSEHCGHPTFKAKVMVRQPDGSYIEKSPLYERITAAAKAHPNYERLVSSAFIDNSGVMRFYDGYAICGKVETHNSPSAIEPYGGAMTGSGGVFRDIMGTGKGAKTIISTDMFCFAPEDLDESQLPPGTLHPDYLQRRVVAGVRDYGNRKGIPTANGSVHYHEDFRAKPTVIVGAYGIMPEKFVEKGEPQIGDLVVVIGGRTGRDGIHGATFSSGEMTDRTVSVNSSAVQIGNAIEQKRMADALLEARDAELIRALTDCGAAGFSSAIGEMGEDIGVTVDISKAPVKYPGLAPWEIWLSESQERMAAAIAPEHIESFLAICAKYNVEATMLGEFDGSHTLTVNYGEQNVIELDYDFLKNGLPQRVMYAHWERPEIPEVRPAPPENEQAWVDRFKAVLAHGNVCSKEPIVRQYDHGVQGGNIVAPFGGLTQEGPNDALVIRPLLGKPYGVVQSHGMNPILNRLDPYEGTVWAVAEAAANYVAVGGDIDEAVMVGNYIWPFPDEDSMGSLDLAVQAATDMTRILKLPPVVSGKDSLSSTYRGKDGTVIKIPPVYCASIFGRIPDVEKTMTSDIKDPGNSTLYLVGKTNDDMGGSTYYNIAQGSSAEIPRVDKESLPKTLQAVQKLIASGKALACHDVSEGGVATTVAEMCFGSNAGANLLLPSSADEETFLFSETAGCFVLEVPNSLNIYLEFGPGEVEMMTLGVTTKDTDFSVSQYSDSRGYRTVFATPIKELKDAWQARMKGIFHG